MKPVIYFLLFLLPAVSMAQQSNDQRTVSTKIADVLAKFPADNSKLNDLNVERVWRSFRQLAFIPSNLGNILRGVQRWHRIPACTQVGPR